MGPPGDKTGAEPSPAAASGSASAAAESGKPVKPPFAVTGELDGLLLTWFDNAGVHTASKRSEIPEASRAQVRIDSLAVAPEARLDPDLVYIADVRAPAGDGSYAVRTQSRAWFDAQVDKAKPPEKVDVQVASGGVVIYKASWCHVCREAAKFLTEKHVAFEEKDVEKDPGAQAEMLKKTQAKGLVPTGVPVIDFHGEILLGFDQRRLSQLISAGATPI